MEESSETHHGKGLTMICWLFTALFTAHAGLSACLTVSKSPARTLEEETQVQGSKGITQGHTARKWQQSQCDVVFKNKSKRSKQNQREQSESLRVNAGRTSETTSEKM